MPIDILPYYYDSLTILDGMFVEVLLSRSNAGMDKV